MNVLPSFTSSQWLICIGLALDIAGVVMLYRYGLPSKMPQAEPFTWTAPPEAEVNRFKRKSYVGLWLLILGFALQLVGTASQ